MRLSEFPLLTDENVHPAVVAFLRAEGLIVRDVKEDGLRGTSDDVLLRLAREAGLVIVTHDRDFGRMAIAALLPFFGILFLRPGHIDPEFSISTLRTVLSADVDLRPPFILVAQRSGGDIAIRLRRP